MFYIIFVSFVMFFNHISNSSSIQKLYINEKHFYKLHKLCETVKTNLFLS
ncbi:hypothetical protein CHCC20441_2884 [Bacillus licheniformis]|uniref:Uncharacterized protein n=1 Tax=Bacillus licheniformis TaxID=1402 RepID=A0A8B5Y9J4_BACLI|nr:hypothetical protein B4092_0727 [Bacillus licheniformis]TWN09105.1 hypothetical protein CHCC14564_4340 [Bacillus licheniformis LMG 17339]KYC74438.1 hypothetical protein B4090_0999 [Bacillus licheniformis]KYC82814.1 hypothetical protein B4091_0639 [Bacillus licheniformis]KYC99832.1 hypothetical protein B4164_0746 [Bacillus licheniformis]